MNSQGYIERRTTGRKGKKCKKDGMNWRNWWLIKNYYEGSGSIAILAPIIFPENMVGKRIRLKVEVIEDGRV